ncbi:MAG TPA: GNAT family N-acetyltransferase [Beijerinckiaceae bacterium]
MTTTPDPALIQALEGRLVNAWPSLEAQVCDGWLLRFAKGYSKRANAATPFLPGAGLTDEGIAHVVTQYEAQHIRPIFRLTGLEADGVASRLEAHGFQEVEPSCGMVAEVGDGPTIGDAVTITPQATKAWIRGAAEAYGGDKADDGILTEIVSRIRQTAGFATLRLDDRPVAWGMGVAERGYVGLYDIVVAPDLRGLGLGRQLVCALLAWGRDAGAASAYLQVREDNEAARALYRALGFSDAYRYVHRIRPATPAGP